MVLYSVIKKNKITSFDGEMDSTRDNRGKLNNPDSETQIYSEYFLWFMDPGFY